MTDKPQKPPKFLQKPGREHWKNVVKTYEIQPHQAPILALACQALDRAHAAREAIDKGGATVTDRFGQTRANPACAIERDAMSAFARLLRELGLDLVPEAPRPPMRGGRRA